MQGGYQQQDANECYSTLLNAFRGPLKDANEGEDIIGNLFELEMEVELKNQETEAEEPTKKIEKRLQVQCHIDNNNNPID